MAEIRDPRVVLRRFPGPVPEGGEGVYWYGWPMVVDVTGWRTTVSLEAQGVIRKLERGEQVGEDEHGQAVVVLPGQAGGQAQAGGERASSLQVDTEPDPPADPEGDEEPADDEEDASAPEIKHVGGGWYNVVVEGKVMNPSPIQGKPAAQEYADGL